MSAGSSRGRRTWLIRWSAGGKEMRCLVVGYRREAAALRAAKRRFGAIEPMRALRLGATDIDRERESGVA